MTYDELNDLVQKAGDEYRLAIQASNATERQYQENVQDQAAKANFEASLAKVRELEAKYIALNNTLFNYAKGASNGVPIPTYIDPNVITKVVNSQIQSAKSMTTEKSYPSLWVWLAAGATIYFLMRRKRA